MTERYDADLWFGHIEGELSPEESAEFQKLLDEDESLKTFVQQLTSDCRLLKQLPRYQAPASIMENVQKKIERQVAAGQIPEDRIKVFAPSRGKSGSKGSARGASKARPGAVAGKISGFPKWKMGVAAAAMVAIAAGIFVMFSGDKQQPEMTAPMAVVPRVVNTAAPVELVQHSTNGDYIAVKDASGAPVVREASAASGSENPDQLRSETVTMRITTSNAQGVESNVLSWAQDNQVKVDQTQMVALRGRDGRGRRFILIIRGDQLPQMVAHLSRQHGGRVHIQFRSSGTPMDEPTNQPQPMSIAQTDWHDIMQRQLPMETSVPLYDEHTQVVMPVVFNEP